MIKVLLFEDCAEDVEQIKCSLPVANFEIVGVAKGLDQGLKMFFSLEFDIVLIDIFLNNRPEGIQFANEINNSEINKPFIFLTSSIEQNVFNSAKSTQPFNYLIKPFNKMELLFSIELAIEKFASKNGAFIEKKPVFCNDCLFVKKDDSLIKISLDDISYVIVEGQYCKMVTEKGEFLIQVSLNQFADELPDSQFLRTHRNYMVNLKKIEAIYPNDNLILLKNNEKVLLSRRLKSEIIGKYKIYK